MWSASSSTVISTASRVTKPCFMRSSRRPGQATTMSTPALQRLDLAASGVMPPKIVVVVQAVGRGERGEDGVDLRGELAGRGEHEAERAAGAARAAGELAAEAGDHRDGEREGLAGAGLAAAEHVAAGEGVGQGVDLDREGAGLALRGEHAHERCGHAECGEGGDVGRHG